MAQTHKGIARGARTIPGKKGNAMQEEHYLHFVCRGALLLALSLSLAAGAGCASDSGGGKNAGTVPPNSPPTLSPIAPPPSVSPPDTLIFGLSAADPDMDPIALSATPLPANATFADNGNGTGGFSFSPDATQVGTLTVTFGANDGINPGVTQDVNLIVTATPNLPPALDPIPSPQSAVPPATLAFSVTATDADGDPMVLSASPIPPNATFTDNSDGTGDFSFAPDNTQRGTYTITFGVDDGVNPQVTQEVVIFGSDARIVHIGTASNNVVAVVVETDPGVSTPTQDPAQWTVDGGAPGAVGRWSYPWYEDKSTDNITMRHHLYLELATPLVSGVSYSLDTPYGTLDFPFDDRKTLCESLHVNQVGYFGGSAIRYSNLGVFLGDLGPRTLAGSIDYEVIAEVSGSPVVTGQGTFWGDDTQIAKGSGEYVYRLDLSALPDGGPYFISVAGIGRSHSFGVGPQWSSELAYVHTRGLYHQRCGLALEQPYTAFTRGACHTTVEVTDAEPPGFITLTGPTRSIRGGYHDAGDFDRRLVHTLIPVFMLHVYEVFPNRFTDGQFDIPESGNGIPDWLDEALWGVLLWEELQESDGGVRAGTEADRHPTYGEVNAETDDLVYRTFRRDGHTTASGAGMFAQASRLLEPFDATRAAALLTRAENAWQWVQANSPPAAHAAQRMYAALQLYLTTSDPTYHTEFLASANYLTTASWPEQYNPVWFNLNSTWDGMIFSPYFFSYLITSLPADPAIQSFFLGELTTKSNSALGRLDTRAYPLGPAGPIGWGSAVNQGRYADSVMLMYRLTGDQKYLDAASQLADYSMGLNPLGKCYATGLGANPPNNPLQLDSYFTVERGLGPVPGIVIYGPVANPSGISYQQKVWSKVYPAWSSLPEQRRYCEGWSLIGVQEFTTYDMVLLNACLYAFLGPTN